MVFVVAFAVLCPAINLKYLQPRGSRLFDISLADCSVVSGGSIDKNGRVIVDDGAECVVQYELNNLYARGIELELAVAAKTFTEIDFECSAACAQTFKLFKDEKNTCCEVAPGIIRFYFEEDCVIQKITFYDTAPIWATKQLKIKTIRYIAVIAMAILTFVGMFLLDKSFGVWSKLLKELKKRKKRILYFVLGLISAVVAAGALEAVFRMIVGPDSIGNHFNMASFGTFAIITVSVFIFIFERKNLSIKPERAVALLILAAGFLIIFTEPFSHNSSDEDSHYYLAVQNSFYDEAYLSTSDYNVKYTIGFSIAGAHALEPSMEKVSVMNANDQVATYAKQVSGSLPHRAAGAFIAVARLFGASFWEKFIIGQLAMLFIYSATVYFAIRKLKSGKMIMSIIAFFPTTLVLASNYSYDPWVTGFSMLGTAYFISEIEQPEKKISLWETIVMCSAFVLAALPKQVYVFLMVLPLFMFKKWSTKTEKRKYYFVLLAFFVFMFTLFLLRSFSSVTGGGDVRGGNVDSMGQFEYILTNPFEYAKTLIKFLAGYLSPLNAGKYMTFFSYLGDGGSAIIFMTALGFCSVTDKNQINRFEKKNIIRIVVLVVDFALVCMMATALYISFTPVASTTINGCNARYLIPLIAPLALTITNPGFKIVKNSGVYNFVVLAVVYTTVVFKILYVVTWPML